MHARIFSRFGSERRHAFAEPRGLFEPAWASQAAGQQQDKIRIRTPRMRADTEIRRAGREHS